MGVVVHILDRRTVQLEVAGTLHTVGTLRRLAKVTELDDRQAADLAEARLLPSPVAVMVASPEELPAASDPPSMVAAHPVIGWEDERGSVVDQNWDYLPLLGYAVRNWESDRFVLHEQREGTLHPIGSRRAEELGLLSGGLLVQRNQPTISGCFGVRPFIPGFAEADCILQDGRRERLLIRINGDALPEPSWLVSKRPIDTQEYTPDQIGSANRSE